MVSLRFNEKLKDRQLINQECISYTNQSNALEASN